MGFRTPIAIEGRNYTDAYIRARLARSDKIQIVIKLEVWEDKNIRDADLEPLRWNNDLIVLPKKDVDSVNPEDYAYRLLQASGEFPDAIWNQ